jgi:hypothetical protein
VDSTDLLRSRAGVLASDSTVPQSAAWRLREAPLAALARVEAIAIAIGADAQVGERLFVLVA